MKNIFNHRKTILALSVTGLLILSACGRNPVSREPVSKTDFKLDTVVTITLYDSDDASIIDSALEMCDTYEKIFSRTDSDSELYKLNHRTLDPVGQAADTYEISKDLYNLISRGLYYSEISEGAFSIAVAPLTSLWDFKSDDPKIPDEEEIAQAVLACDHAYSGITLKDGCITFASEDIMIDLGAIAKGYIADELKEYLLSQNVHQAIISLGGNILCIGGKTEDTPFTIGIQKPFGSQTDYTATVKDHDRSVVTSGTYQRYFEKDGTIYHHILNPSTGYPYQNDLTSVTIISDSSLDGDALSTTCFALGLEDGLHYLASLKDTYGIFITENGEIITSSDFPSEYEFTVLD